MLKFLPLALAIVVFPFSQQVSNNSIVAEKSNNGASSIFNFKYTPSFNPRPTGSSGRAFEPEKKSAEPWSGNWMATAQENIRQSEYNFKWEEKLKAYCTPNRKNNLRFFYNNKGFTVEPRTTKIPIGEFNPMAKPDEIKYKNIPGWKIKFNLNKKQVGNGKWQIVNNKAEYVTDKITVQYINNDEGMRQNFIVHTPLSKSNELKINFNIKTKLKTQLNGNRLQFFHKKTNVLNYQDLKVWDATGKTLIAAFKKTSKGKFFIYVDTREAVYPITIDPISTTPAALVESNQANAVMGWSVASAGDVNGDGYSDVMVGAYLFDNGQSDEGRALVYHGSASGINTTAAATVESDQAGAYMGRSVASAGDVNGDGYSDVMVGAYFYSNGQTNEGRAYVYHGSASGINTTLPATVESNQASAFMGFSVASAGDVNGDGYSDVMVGAYGYDNGQTNEGAAFVYHGSATGINTTPADTLESNQAIAFMGWSEASAGDVNGDGYSDVMVGAPFYVNGQTDEGAAFVYHGSATGINTTPVTTVESNQAGAQMGASVAFAGDVNGDGYSDVIVGAYLYDNGQTNEGRAYVYHGSATGISTTASATVESNQAGAQMGFSVASAGDVNGDGCSDVMVGAYLYDNGETNEGAVFVYHGSVGGIITAPTATMESNQASAQMGISVSSAGDVNGDGYSDVIVGASDYDNGETNEGAAFVYHGSADGINTTATSTVESNQDGAQTGYSVASAGDVNGDGYSDVIVGAWQFDDGANTDEGRAFVYHGSPTGINTAAAAFVESNQANARMGNSVASAGDVNGDGYSDVIVGAYFFDNGENNEGRAYVHHGSATGINTTAAAIMESNLAEARMGISVASAGDINADGYADVVVGAYQYNNAQSNEGAAFVYRGSLGGIITTPAAILESNQPNAFMGWSVASAGDVNGDGFSDVVVGAYFYDNGQNNEGAAFIYHGFALGINTTPATVVDSNQADALMGISVASASDVNGDGYADIIVGAYLFDNGQSDEGAAFVYHGSASGINTTPVASVESDQPIAYFGASVASAGDINGDGYSDVIAGSYQYDNGEINEGAAFIYLGSPSGINTTPATTLESNQANANMGISVASAGDVNGDGYSDVIVGAHFFDNVETDEGGAFVYHGNSPGNNKRNNLRLYNTDLTTPVSRNNFNLSNFGAGLYARSFMGRAKGKMVWETRLSYNAYSGTPITNSTFFTAQQAAYSDLGLNGIELKNLINKIAGARLYTKLRARVKYDPVTAITGQVYGPWRNVSSIIDANNLGILPIELISFNAAWVQKGKTARLDFKTDKESGVCCFDIEKSSDGFNFYRIGTLPAKNTSGVQAYTFIDANATAKKQFYRLKIKGIAGQTDYSNIQQLSNDKATEILVFPNPTTDVLQLQLNKAYEKMNVRIINASGQPVKQMQVPASNQVITIPVQHLAAGKYWLQLQSGSDRQVLQFVKQ
jgi:hypothetical protein